MLNKCLVLCLIFSLAGCSKLSVSDLATSAGAGAGALAGAATGLGPVVTVTSTVAGGVAAGALVGEEVTTAEACNANPETCKTIATFHFLEDSVHWIVGAGVVLLIAAWLIPGPQRLWRRKDGKSDHSAHRARQGRRRN